MKNGIFRKSTFLFFISTLILSLSSCSSGQKTTSQLEPAKVVANNSLKRIDMKFYQFPRKLQDLGEQLRPAQYQQVFNQLKTDVEKYTITALAEQVASQTVDEKAKEGLRSFFIEAAQAEFDWTKAVAIRGLAHTAEMENMHFLIKFLDEENPAVVDETLIALKVVFDKQKVEAQRSPAASTDTPAYTIPDAAYWKKWAKDN